MPLPLHQERVVEEKDDLEGKIKRLTDFFDTEIFEGLDGDEQFRMRTQARFMAGYLATLEARIAHF